ncbi:hypothetical protein DMENIID0001_114140 [Sergentomyia squamirostris]
MQNVASVGENFERRERNLYGRIALSLEYIERKKGVQKGVNLATKSILMKHLHEQDHVKIGQFVHINYKTLFSTIVVLFSNLAIFMQFRQFEIINEESVREMNKLIPSR